MQAGSLRAGKKASSIGNSLTIKTKKEMKKNLFMVAAVALMALVSCNKEEITNNENIAGDQIETPSDIVFVAEFDQESDTKIALGDLVDGVRKTTWVAGDEIKINGTVFSAKEAGESSEFTTTASFAGAKTYRAVYPASSYISTAAVDIPATQNGTFASASIAVAESSTTSLKFNNLVTILKFQVPVNCSKVTFESTASIAGRITVNYEDGVMTPDYSGVTQPNNIINVTGSFVPGTDYYVAVKPGSHTLTVRIDGYLSKTSTKPVTLERSKIMDLKTLPNKEVSIYGLAGTMQSSRWDAGNPMVMYKDVNNKVLIKNVELFKTDQFKVVVNNSWNENYGVNGNNLEIHSYGTYDVEFDITNKTITCSKISDEINRTVRFVFNLDTDNNKKWFTAANMYVWGNVGEIFGKYPGKAMTKNGNTLYVDLPGKCVGETINYKIGNPSGNWTTGDRSINITIDGATVNGSSVGIQ